MIVDVSWNNWGSWESWGSWSGWESWGSWSNWRSWEGWGSWEKALAAYGSKVKGGGKAGRAGRVHHGRVASPDAFRAP